MRKNRRDNIRRERIIMVASSAFVLTALTMTGLYMKGQEARQQDDGYTLDFSALGNNTGSQLDNIGNEQAKNSAAQSAKGQAGSVLNNDLDYTPVDDELSAQAGSSLVEIPGVTDNNTLNAPGKSAGGRSSAGSDADGENTDGQGADPSAEDAQGAADESETPAVPEVHYSESEGLTKPVNGEILLPYSMDGSIYFATLDQYKYNPATLFEAQEGSEVSACSDGVVVNVFEDAELGRGVTLQLGDGYTVTYGQLKDICVTQGEYVENGEKLGVVASPTKYYVQEGTNLYLRMEKDGKPMNAEYLF